MRVSIVESDPGFVVDPISYRVTVDGEAVEAVTADEETGECWVWCRDALNQGEPRTKLMHGEVRIERWESDDVAHPPGTVGFLDRDGWWVWCTPDNPDYAGAVGKATHFWDHEGRAWVDSRRLARH